MAPSYWLCPSNAGSLSTLSNVFCYCHLALLLLPSRLSNWHCTFSMPHIGAQDSRHCCQLKLPCCRLCFSTCFQSFSNTAFALLFQIIHPTSHTRNHVLHFILVSHHYSSILAINSFIHLIHSNMDYTRVVAAVRLGLSLQTQLLPFKHMLLRLPGSLLLRWLLLPLQSVVRPSSCSC